MERKNHSIQGNMNRKSAMIILLVMFPLLAPGQDYAARIYQAYVNSRMDHWKEVMDEMEISYRHTRDIDLLYQLTEAQYGYIAYLIGEGNKRDAKRLLEKAEENVEILLGSDRENPKIYCLQGAFYGFRVGLEPIKAPIFGRKSVDANEIAIDLGPYEPQAWLEKANIEFYKPAIFGGSKQRAVPFYEKAIRLFEATPGRTKNSWIYLNALTALATAYEETGAIRQADRVYRKLLELEPSFEWIRDEVYPKFKRTHPLKHP